MEYSGSGGVALDCSVLRRPVAALGEMGRLSPRVPSRDQHSECSAFQVVQPKGPSRRRRRSNQNTLDPG